MKNILGIEGYVQFWQEIVLPNWMNYQKHPTAREAFNLAGSLWHLTDWITEYRYPNHSRADVSGEQDAFELMCPQLGAMHDIVTAYKHAKVSTPRGKVTNTHSDLQGATFYFGPNILVSEHLADFRVVLEDGCEYDLNQLFEAVVAFWDQYINVIPHAEDSQSRP